MYIKTATMKYTNEYNPFSQCFSMSGYWTDSTSCNTRWFEGVFQLNFCLWAQFNVIIFPLFRTKNAFVCVTYSGFWLYNNSSVAFRLHQERKMLKCNDNFSLQNYFWLWNDSGLQEKLWEIVCLAEKFNYWFFWLVWETFTWTMSKCLLEKRTAHQWTENSLVFHFIFLTLAAR